MNSKKVFIIDGGGAYYKMFEMYGWEVVSSIEEADLVLFTGGEDVTPSLYGEAKHPTTSNNPYRDDKEQLLFHKALHKGMPMAGICRGGQFLNVMCGGKLYQHVGNHAISGLHEAIDSRSGRTLGVTSTHHQMMRPAPSGEVLCYAKLGGFREHIVNGEVKQGPTSGDDVEVVLYKEQHVLCFQPHPEFVVYDEEVRECSDYFFQCLQEVLL